MNTSGDSSVREKVAEGLRRSYRKLVERKAKEGGVLVLSVNGKITQVPAAELLAQLNKND